MLDALTTSVDAEIHKRAHQAKSLRMRNWRLRTRANDGGRAKAAWVKDADTSPTCYLRALGLRKTPRERAFPRPAAPANPVRFAAQDGSKMMSSTWLVHDAQDVRQLIPR